MYVDSSCVLDQRNTDVFHPHPARSTSPIPRGKTASLRCRMRTHSSAPSHAPSAHPAGRRSGALAHARGVLDLGRRPPGGGDVSVFDAEDLPRHKGIVLISPDDLMRNQQMTYLDLPPDMQKAPKAAPKTDVLSDKNRIAESRHPTLDKKDAGGIEARRSAEAAVRAAGAAGSDDAAPAQQQRLSSSRTRDKPADGAAPACGSAGQSEAAFAATGNAEIPGQFWSDHVAGLVD